MEKKGLPPSHDEVDREKKKKTSGFSDEISLARGARGYPPLGRGQQKESSMKDHLLWAVKIGHSLRKKWSKDQGNSSSSRGQSVPRLDGNSS